MSKLNSVDMDTHLQQTVIRKQVTVLMPSKILQEIVRNEKFKQQMQAPEHLVGCGLLILDDGRWFLSGYDNNSLTCIFWCGGPLFFGFGYAPTKVIEGHDYTVFTIYAAESRVKTSIKMDCQILGLRLCVSVVHDFPAAQAEISVAAHIQK